MPSRVLDFPVFDSDNHFYETTEALTKYLPEKHKDVVQYVEVKGRTKIVVRGVISDYIPNPTFSKVARPGAQEDYFRFGNPDKKSYREIMGDPMEAIPAFREPVSRLEVMNELGLDYSLMFPTLASLVEERMKDDVDLTHIVIHALNEWMHETWGFNHENRIFTTPVITLPHVDKAIEELRWCLERGARTVLIRPAPVPGYKGTRSPGLPEFDPFWAEIVKAGIPVTMHASDSGYADIIGMWEPSDEFLPFKPSAFSMAATGKRPIEDCMMAMVCHGALSRFPDLRLVSVENGADWVHHVIHQLESAYSRMPGEFLEDPVVAFKRGVYVSPFWEDDFQSIVDVMGAGRIVFGSDWPHPEGLKDPITFVDDLKALPDEDIAKIMGGNMMELMKVSGHALPVSA